MKPIKLIGTSALFLFLGIGAPAYARQDKPDDHSDKSQAAKPEDTAKPAKPAEPAKQPDGKQPEDQAKPAAPQDEAKPAKSADQPKPTEQPKAAEQPKPAEQPKTAQQPEQAKPAEQQQAQAPQRGPVQRSASEQQTQRSQPAVRVSVRTTVRIPDAQFSANFGQGHNFRMGNPEMVGGYSRFQYGGFWFGFVQPWPADWYYTDDVYIDYVDGGYYMYDPYYPGSRIEISVVM
jgi:outer membrane biosynthesis protein TonB